jgi:hypothetical protein
MKPWRLAALLVPALALLAAACTYEAPLTAEPTRRVEPRLLGAWEARDGDRVEHLDVRRYDDRHYVLSYEGELFVAHHSDFADRPFVSVRSLEGEGEGKYAYVVWRLSPDGKELRLRAVQEKVLPAKGTDPAAMQKALRPKLADPALLGEEIVFRRPPSRR